MASDASADGTEHNSDYCPPTCPKCGPDLSEPEKLTKQELYQVITDLASLPEIDEEKAFPFQHQHLASLVSYLTTAGLAERDLLEVVDDVESEMLSHENSDMSRDMVVTGTCNRIRHRIESANQGGEKDA